jgi:hypothetical protein
MWLYKAGYASQSMVWYKSWLYIRQLLILMQVFFKELTLALSCYTH